MFKSATYVGMEVWGLFIGWMLLSMVSNDEVDDKAMVCSSFGWILTHAFLCNWSLMSQTLVRGWILRFLWSCNIFSYNLYNLFIFLLFSFVWALYLGWYHYTVHDYDYALGWHVHSVIAYLGQFSPVGHYFASSSHDRTARIWSMDRIQPLRIMAGHLSDVDVGIIFFCILLYW